MRWHRRRSDVRLSIGWSPPWAMGPEDRLVDPTGCLPDSPRSRNNGLPRQTRARGPRQPRMTDCSGGRWHLPGLSARSCLRRGCLDPAHHCSPQRTGHCASRSGMRRWPVAPEFLQVSPPGGKDRPSGGARTTDANSSWRREVITQRYASLTDGPGGCSSEDHRQQHPQVAESVDARRPFLGVHLQIQRSHRCASWSGFHRLQ